jgi:hypothetical protein
MEIGTVYYVCVHMSIWSSSAFARELIPSQAVAQWRECGYIGTETKDIYPKPLKPDVIDTYDF